MHEGNGEDNRYDGASRPRRTPTVQEAIQYSPFTSIVPFNHDILPFVSATPSSVPTIFTNQEERRKSRQTLETLNAEALSGQTTSARLERTLEDLRSLLDPEKLTKIQFKQPPHIVVSGLSNTSSRPDGSKVHSHLPEVSSFAQMVYRNSNVQFGYPSPTSPQEKGKRRASTAKNDRKPAPPKTQTHQTAPPPAPGTPARRQEVQVVIERRNDAALSHNAQLVPEKRVQVTPSKSPSGPAVVIPALPGGSQKEEYENFPEVDARVRSSEGGLSKKRKREDVGADDAFAISIDQREKAEAAVMDLEAVMLDVFEAEDELQSHASAAGFTRATRYFVFRTFEDQEIPTLSPAIQSRLESAIQKVISLSRFSEISADNLARVQKLCENSVQFVESTGLAAGDSWGEGDVEEWVQRLDQTVLSLQAGKILLRIMTAGREEKQLYSADILQTIINALRHIVDICLIPVVEARPTGDTAASFAVFSAQKKPVTGLLTAAGRVLKLMGDLLLRVDVAEDAVTAIEFLSTRLIFVENAHTEKDSALGVQKFETTRRIAMDVVAKVFSRYPDQRSFIFDEILTSLEKLPVTRQSARQFKMLDGKPIQLVSALLMRLIQTSATYSLKSSKVGKAAAAVTNGDADDESDDDERDGSPQKRRHPTNIQNPDVAAEELHSVAKPLQDAAESSAQYLVKFMVQRALTATKTGDQPYRNLLDIFTEDFVSVLGSSDWPASELLLRVLLGNMIGLMESEKSAAPAKSMALDLMGLMGSAISDLQLHVRQASRNLDCGEELSSKLVQLADDVLDDKHSEEELLEFDGPYRVTIEYLESRNLDDAQLQSARGFHLMQWAKIVTRGFRDDDDDDDFARSLGIKLANMILDPKWLEAEYEFENVSTSQGKLAAALVTLTSPFCKALKRILSILLSSMTNDQATVKSRGLKSVVQLLEKDPSILDRGNYVLNHILRCTGDHSPLVRDSALSLIGKCLSLRPSLESDVLKTVIARASDAAIGVRKRAMKTLKDIYSRNNSRDTKSSIADTLLQRIKDNDESVSDLARQTFEEIWISPFHSMNFEKSDTIQSKLALKNQVSLIIRTIQRGEPVMMVLNVLLRSILSNNSKTAAANFRVCKAIVGAMFDGIIDQEEIPDRPSQQNILATLTVFAQANPKLFTGQQLELLQPYVGNLSTTDDLLIYRSVIVIFRHVLPYVNSLQDSFLKAVQQALLASVSKLGKAELEEVSSCLWTINGVLKNPDRLVRLTISVLHGIQSSKSVDFSDDAQKATLNRVKRYIMIAGFFGKSCDLDDYARAFHEKFPWWKGTSVAGLTVDTICPFTRPGQHPALREMALESMGMVCQAWPKEFLRTDVNASFELVFKDHDPRLEHIVLSGFRGFFNIEEKRSETGADIATGEGTATGSQRLGKSLVANENDGVSTCIAQGFLQEIIRIALGKPDDLALTATQVIASINRQGLMHPKECGPALVALETSPDQVIATIAFQEHRNLHEKHETMFEKEYMKAVVQAFNYQKDVMNNPRGAIVPAGSNSQQLVPKMRLTFDVLKLGNSKTRKRFLANFASRVDFELTKLDTSEDVPIHLQFSRFVVENLAFFDYGRIDEILHTVACLEKVVTNTGTSVAHAIETDVLKVGLEQKPTADEPASEAPPTLDLPANLLELPIDAPIEHASPVAPAPPPPAPAPVDPARLHHLAVASMILTLAWETRTFLRRLWNLQKLRDQAHAAKTSGDGTSGTGAGGPKAALKDLAKTPIRNPGVSGDKYRDRVTEVLSALRSSDAMMAQCREFAELLAIDNELRVAADEDGAENELARAAAGYETPSGDEAGPLGAPGSGRGRKRKASVPGATPKKKRKSGGGTTVGKKGKRTARSGSSVSVDGDAGGWD